MFFIGAHTFIDDTTTSNNKNRSILYVTSHSLTQEKLSETGEFPSKCGSGIGDGFWWAWVSMTTVG